LLSLALTVIAQKPVITAENATAAGAHPPVLVAVGTTSETSTVYDANEKVWKRWTMRDVDGRRVLVMATSADGVAWDAGAGAGNVCFAPSDVQGAWDSGAISAPTVLLNPSADDDLHRFVLTYAGSSTDGGGAMPATEIGIAYSADGRSFKRAGVVLGGEGMSYGEPRLMLADGEFELSYFRVKTGAGGIVEQAGLGTAVSTDGVKWDVRNDSPVTVEVVGKTPPTAKLVQRLRQLVDAYSESPL
jgi:hypothetical protein